MHTNGAAKQRIVRAAFYGLLVMLPAASRAAAQTEFETASIHLSKAQVKFERNGHTEVRRGTLQMDDVTISSCIQWAYGTSQGLVNGPPTLTEARYDILAKADPNATKEQMRLMLRALLADRFKLTFHREKREMRVYTLTLAKSGLKMQPAASPDGEAWHENNAMGMVAKSMTIRELAYYVSDPLNAPLTDGTGLAGRYDFTVNFTPYVDMNSGDRPDVTSVIKAALKGELGLEMIQRKDQVDVIVVNRVEAPSGN